MTALFVGFGAGFITAIPVAGPVSALIFSQGMRGRFGQGRGVALGAALTEAVYVFLAFWGFSRIAPRFPRVFLASHVAAAAILVALGVYFFRSKKLREPPKSRRANTTRLAQSFLMGAGVSAMNPSVIATWAALIATLYTMGALRFSTANAALFSGGVAAGIFVWFWLFLRLIAKHRDRIGERALDRILKGFGVVLLGLAGFMLVRLFRGE